MLMPDVSPALRKIMAAGFGLVMVTNQDGLGTGSFPQRDFDGPHQWLLALLASQGIRFHEVLVDASRPEDGLDTRKPRSEEHTSELQSRGHLVCRLLLEKKKRR